MKQTKYKSKCCGADVEVQNGGSDFIGDKRPMTHWHVCTKCKEACDIEQTNKCNCEEVSCKDDCTLNHTHKQFWCEKCHPERYETRQSLEEIKNEIVEYLESNIEIDIAMPWTSIVKKNDLIKGIKQIINKIK